VFIQEDGERSIVMAPASTSQISAENVQNYFGKGFVLYARIASSRNVELLFFAMRSIKSNLL